MSAANDTFAHEDTVLVDVVARRIFDGAQRVRAWAALSIDEANAFRRRAIPIIRAVRQYDALPPAPVVLIPHLGRIS